MKPNAPQLVVMSFLVAVIIGTLLLTLPVAHNVGVRISLIDSLFTATSATCVVGLIVRDTSVDWSHFGQVVILLLIQAGGLGIMTLSTFFAVLLGGKLTLKQDLVIQSTLDHNRVYGARNLILSIVGLTLLMEAIGALLLFIRWGITESWPLQERLAKSVFHSVSAFCNAGFSLFSDNLMRYEGDVWINILIMLLIFIGGIGFVVILDMYKGIFSPRTYKSPRLSLQSKLALTFSIFLIFIGAILILVFERNNVLNGMSAKERLIGSLFQAVTSRTAGFNTLPISQLAPPTLMLLMLLMFIGASPGSTGGGIKTCTFAVVMATIWAMSKNRDKVFIFRRTIPRAIVRRAILIFIMALIWIFSSTLIFAAFEQKNLGSESIIAKSLFEVTSAFGTVGLSTGITPQLSTIGKIVIIITMFVGRIGPLTLALAVAIKEEKIGYTYPEERIMVG